MKDTKEIALYTNVDNDRSKNHVKIMTIHQSKGLEFPYVFISGLSDGIMPNKRSVRERKKKAPLPRVGLTRYLHGS